MHKEIMQKQEILDRAKVVLKDEFVGIDHVIDDVIDAVGSWYLFPDLQERPIVINLWGLTGVGKSSLVKRIVHFMNLKTGSTILTLVKIMEARGTLKAASKRSTTIQKGTLLLAFDELQHA